MKRFNDHKKKYSVTDVRWRHVGSYEYNTNKINSKQTQKEECILFDLTDLESVNGDKSFVDDHMDIFTNISCSDEWCVCSQEPTVYKCRTFKQHHVIEKTSSKLLELSMQQPTACVTFRSTCTFLVESLVEVYWIPSHFVVAAVLI